MCPAETKASALFGALRVDLASCQCAFPSPFIMPPLTLTLVRGAGSRLLSLLGRHEQDNCGALPACTCYFGVGMQTCRKHLGQGWQVLSGG